MSTYRERVEALDGWAYTGMNTPVRKPILAIATEADATEAQLRAALPVWRPIETAPKDGSKILAWAPDLAPISYYGVAFWAEAQEANPRSVAGWFWSYATRPTHWQPLPPPPEALAQQHKEPSNG
jgi:hypothetical protein